MHLGVQYYRAPFPNRRYWADDFARIRDCGLDTVQLWVVWGWVEPSPGEFRFEDYDELMAEADKAGLHVVLSTIAEIQPMWIHRILPDSHLVDHLGHRVPSCNRRETHFGTSPGGCTDHPEVWRRMETFLRTVAERYHTAGPLIGWDAWNELRWNVMAEMTGNRTCYCPYTIAAWHEWLREQFDDLDGLNDAWQRRYVDWADVQPGRHTAEPYTHMMSFQHFITVRASRLGIARANAIKAVDQVHPVTVHGDRPCMETEGNAGNFPLHRGNDWDMAAEIDGIGTSSFPKWGVNVESNWADFVDRIQATLSAARGRQVWLSEVQGGRASKGFTLFDPVEPADQQSWVWIGQSAGAQMLLFWCWRDEVFGQESNGFGMSGADGFAEERQAAMKRTAAAMTAHREMFDRYRPNLGNVGVLVSPHSMYLAWAQEKSGDRVLRSVKAYAAAMTRASIPYRIVEEDHLDALHEIAVLFVPRAIVFSDEMETKLEAWVRAGGTLVCESETGAFDRTGLYTYPADRWLAGLTGVGEIGRRRFASPQVRVEMPATGTFHLHADQWLTPMPGAGDAWAANDEGALVREVAVDSGRVILLGSYFGTSDLPEGDDFAEFVEALALRGGAARPAAVIDPPVAGNTFPYVRIGRSGETDMLYVFAPATASEVTLQLAPDVLSGDQARELLNGQAVTIETQGDQRLLRCRPGEWGIAVIANA